jgi:ATP-dependent exoDNAse (exonuclease V) alpha subunit
MIINKSQGQTFDRVGIYLTEPVFSHGLLYVAFSRTTSREGVNVVVNETLGATEEDKLRIFTRNIVYKEVLL